MKSRPPALAIALAFLAAYALGPTGAAVAGAADSGYRLAGVMDTGGDGSGSVAILELPSGGQVLIRKGSVIDGGTVTELSRRLVRIAFPDRVLELALSRGAREPEPVRAKTASSEVAAGSHSLSPPLQRSMPRPLPTPLTRNISPAVVRAFVVNGVAGAPSSTDAKQYVDAEIAQELDLPPHSKIVSVNNQAAASADQTVSEVQQALTNGVVVLTVATPQGPQRVYVTPALPSAPAAPDAPSSR